MKILVPTKRVPDTDQKIVASPDGTSVAIEHLPFVVNPFDAIALEEAVRISESASADVEIVAVGAGTADYDLQLRTALAMGATRAIRIDCDWSLDPWNVARLLSSVAKRELPNLIIMGKQAVDDDASQTGQMLAALLDWPQATFASRLEVLDDLVRVECETDHGIETLRLSMPVVITTDLRLNEPRYASMAGIMKAKKKPLDVVTPAELDIELEPRVEVLRYSSAETQRRNERVASVDELIDRLTSDVAVL